MLLAYVIENIDHNYLQSPFLYVENIEFARVFGTVETAGEYMLFLGLDELTHRIVFDESIEPDGSDDDYFEEKIETPY